MRLTLILAFTCASHASFAATFCVDTTADPGTNTAADCVHDCTLKNGGHCSLNNAILAANNNGGANTIAFALGTSGVHTIALADSLPLIYSPLTIDGFTEPGSAPATASSPPTITVELTTSGNVVQALYLNANSNGSLIRGLAIGGVETAIEVASSVDGATITQNFIGLHADGITANGTTTDGIFSNGTHVVVGGPSAADGNYVCATKNNGSGIYSSGGTLTVSNNTVGLDTSGAAAGNGTGVVLIGGGPHLVSHNVISKNGAGVDLQNTVVVTVKSNFIGTNRDGALARGNLGDGIDLVNTSGTAADIVIGGALPSDGNMISANLGSGIVSSSGNATIENNIIGLSATSAALGNASRGVYSDDGSTLVVGGPGVGNVISANATGVWVGANAAPTTVEGNFIGTDATSVLARGNSAEGVTLQSSGHTVGGAAAGTSNVIANNMVGIQTSGTNVLLGNSIFANAFLGIDAGAQGVSTNDDSNEGDSTFNYPLLAQATGNATTLMLSGTLVTTVHGGGSTPPTVRVEYFDAVTCSAQAHGEGKVFLGSQEVSPDVAGNAALTTSLAAQVADGHAISATATELVGGVAKTTSEFSACVTLHKHGTLAWSAATASAAENDGAVTLTVERTDGSFGALAVDISTTPGTALAGGDFTALSTTLAFADGELSKDVLVSLTNDSVAESDETFTVTLSNIQGEGSIGAVDTAIVTITDTDTLSGSDGGGTAGNNGGSSSGTGATTSGSGATSGGTTSGAGATTGTVSGGGKKGCASSGAPSLAGLALVALVLTRSFRRRG